MQLGLGRAGYSIGISIMIEIMGELLDQIGWNWLILAHSAWFQLIPDFLVVWGTVDKWIGDDDITIWNL